MSASLRDQLYCQFIADFLDGSTDGIITVRADMLADQVADTAASVILEMLGLYEWGEGYFCHPLHTEAP